ncbi:phosphopantetheine-binding protein [Streptomyces sp. NPDC005820]|uniref:phosphopantetheine-binding protein n=1 Tax=Streptomyces sp. NPDC005820 TaxID=3157069 RepID=UPI0033DD44AD
MTTHAPNASAEELVTEAVRQAWTDVLGEEPESEDISFFDAGGDSLAAVELIEHLQEQLGRSIRIQDVYRSPRLTGLVTALLIDESAVPAAHHTTGRTVVRFRDADAGRLWCFLPPLSGAVTRYGRMTRLLPLADAVWACETPAALSRQGMRAVADGLAEALIAEGLTGFDEIVLGGYSLGGVFAHEVAGALATRIGHEKVSALLIDPPSPEDPSLTLSLDETFDIFVRVGWRITAQEPAVFLDADGAMDFAGIAAAAAEAATLPKNAGAREVEEAWQVYAANADILTGYVPGRHPDDRRALLRTPRKDESLAPTAGEDWTACEPNPVWAGIPDPERCWAVPLEHFQLLEPPNDVTIARWLVRTADLIADDRKAG